jgi:hypothetical protein
MKFGVGLLGIFGLLPLMGLWSAGAQTNPGVESRQRLLDEVKTSRPALAGLAIQEQLLVLYWLSVDCDVDSEGVRRQILAAGQKLERPLLEAFSLGPLKADTTGNEEALGNQYKGIQAAIKEAGSKQLGETTAKQLAGLSEDEFIRREVENRRIAYQSSALAGLGLIGSKTTIGQLRKIAESSQGPIATAAREAIKTIEEREKLR